MRRACGGRLLCWNGSFFGHMFSACMRVCVKLIALVFEIWRVWPWIGSRVARFYSSRDASMLAIF
jgi:hypothetical protein